MKLLYFGTACNIKNYEAEVSKFKVKPSIATNVFENALLSGFKAHNADVDIFSFPMIPSYPGSDKLFYGGIEEQLECGYKNKWLKTINFVGLKQLSQGISSKSVIRKWLKENKDCKDKAVIIYSVYQPIAKNIVKYCKKYNVPCYAIVADLPRDMYANKAMNKVKKVLSDIYVKNALKIQSEFDGYVFFTDAMSEVMGQGKPYTVVEGIANVDVSDGDAGTAKSDKRAIMYAGAINAKYGIKNLIDAFESTNLDAQLWIFGSGDYENELKKRAEEDERIKYFGRRNRDEILEYEKKATLLVNVRNCNDDFTKYSFPSKTIEYMLSGTPLLTTALPGIPEEYKEFTYMIGDNEVETIKNKITEIFACSDEELSSFGKNASEFIKNNKNSSVQAKKVLDFINNLF